MIEAMDWVAERWDTIAAGLAALYALVSVIVALTPTPDDDAWLRRVAERLSALSPPGSRGPIKLPGRAPKRDGDGDA